MVHSNKGDNVAVTPRESEDNPALADLVFESALDEAFVQEQTREAHTLLPAEIAVKLPPLYTNEEQGEDAIAELKLFTPWTNWTWYASEYDPEERIFFGVVVGHERELGYFSLDELEAIEGLAGLKIERDLHWKPRPLKECQ